DDIDAIIEHVATASFSAKQWSVPWQMRIVFHGVRIGPTAESALYHVLKRVVHDRQWSIGTSLSDYLTDVSSAVRSPGARIAIYRRWNQTTVAFLSETLVTVPSHRLGSAALPFTLVLYSADTGKISTAHMVVSETAARIPGHARWLR
ncbi:MAG TPA: hypothetical protein VFV93_03705, partial [Thermomicrobiales bacterium]|nr:hypothetical protein [Thermomicrobiales bacterium]